MNNPIDNMKQFEKEAEDKLKEAEEVAKSL